MQTQNKMFRIQLSYAYRISTYFDQGLKSIHIVFDNQDLQIGTPKFVERSLYETERPVISVLLNAESKLPRDWHNIMKIRENKKS